MINTYLQFEGKIHYGSKVVAITRNYTKFLSFNTTNVKNMHPHRDSSPGPWITVPLTTKLWRHDEETCFSRPPFFKPI